MYIYIYIYIMDNSIYHITPACTCTCRVKIEDVTSNFLSYIFSLISVIVTIICKNQYKLDLRLVTKENEIC